MVELSKYVQFEPVGQCNLRCQMCTLQFRTYDLGSRRALAAWDLFTRVVDEIPTMEHLQLQGLGEPMMHPPGTPGPQRCDWPWTSAYITYDGYLLPCCIVATPDRVNLGSMADHSFEELWNGFHAQTFRAQLDSDEPPEVCKNCSIYHGVF